MLLRLYTGHLNWRKSRYKLYTDDFCYVGYLFFQYALDAVLQRQSRHRASCASAGKFDANNAILDVDQLHVSTVGT